MVDTDLIPILIKTASNFSIIYSLMASDFLLVAYCLVACAYTLATVLLTSFFQMQLNDVNKVVALLIPPKYIAPMPILVSAYTDVDTDIGTSLLCTQASYCNIVLP